MSNYYNYRFIDIHFVYAKKVKHIKLKINYVLAISKENEYKGE